MEYFTRTKPEVMADSLSAILSAQPERVAIFTDFDGTLVDIAPTPDSIIVPDALHRRLTRLHAALGGALAVISGRTIADIDGFLPNQPFSIGGSHGAERRHLGEIAASSPQIQAEASHIAARVSQALDNTPGLLVEPKPTGVAVHYRAAPGRKDEVRTVIAEVLSDHHAFHALDGKKVIEVRPAGVDKGEAVRALMQVSPFAGRTPVFIGDDVTDEDGFATVRELGGFGIKIGEGETAARFHLPDIEAVYRYFDALIAKPSDAPPAREAIEGSTIK